MIRYSIIIPHKNTPDLLQRCLDSIPVRDDVEVIVVDDNSDSSVVDFEAFPGKEDVRVKTLLTKEGKGAGYARNVGLSQATGEWVIFADADDSFTDNFDNVLDELVERSEDIVFFRMSSVNLLDGTDGHRGDEYSRRVDIAISEHDYTLVLQYSSPCGKAIQHKLLSGNSIYFNEVPYSNDVVFMAKVAVCAQSFYALNVVAYCISVGRNSLTTVKSSSALRLKEDLQGLKILRKKFKLTKEDKYWLFFSWQGVYEYKKSAALRFVPKMLFAMGFPFIEYSLRLFYHDLKSKR